MVPLTFLLVCLTVHFFPFPFFLFGLFHTSFLNHLFPIIFLYISWSRLYSLIKMSAVCIFVLILQLPTYFFLFFSVFFFFYCFLSIFLRVLFLFFSFRFLFSVFLSSFFFLGRTSFLFFAFHFDSTSIITTLIFSTFKYNSASY